MDSKRPRALVITTMFPKPALPNSGIFVARRLRAAAEHADLEIVSPVPWFPFASRLKRYSFRAAIPSKAEIMGLPVRYPRYLSVPRYLKPLDGLFLAASVWWTTRRSQFDLIDAQLAFPEGWAARLLARLRGVPYCITVRGHDVNHLPEFPIRGRQVRTALRGAGRVMGVADALRRCCVALGCPEDRTETIPNGVDRSVFQPIDRAAARRSLRLDPQRRYVVSVGNLVERKGHHVLIQAIALMKQRGGAVPTLLIVGAPSEEGDYSHVLRALIKELQLENEVILAGEQPPERLPYWYSAADVMCLASSKEGWANVLLESLACGTPVVATRVWGTPEVICNDALGRLVTRDPESFASALSKCAEVSFDRNDLVRYVAGYSWEEAGRKLVANYRLALRTYRPGDRPESLRPHSSHAGVSHPS